MFSSSKVSKEAKKSAAKQAKKSAAKQAKKSAAKQAKKRAAKQAKKSAAKQAKKSAGKQTNYDGIGAETTEAAAKPRKVLQSHSCHQDTLYLRQTPLQGHS